MSLEPANRVPHLMFSLFADPSQEGIYRFENVTPGEYRLTEAVWGDGFGAVGRTLYVQLQAGEAKTADFFIKDRTRRVYGQITDADETPIKEATVRALPANVKIADIKQLSLEMQGAALTDADGHYEIPGLSLGDYVIDVRERRTPIEIDRIAATPEQIQKALRENQPRTAKSTFTMTEDDKEVEVNFVLSEN